MHRFLPIKLVLLWLTCLHGHAQQKYWIAQEDLANPPDNMCLPEPAFCSEWLRHCSYELDEADTWRLKESGISLQPVAAFAVQSSAPDQGLLGFALEQLEARAFIRKGLTGRGVKIGIIDGGFLKADEAPSLRHFFGDSLVKAYRDYVTPELEPYDGHAHLDDQHGTEVWQLTGGLNRQKQIQYGLALEAEYYLARTDHGGYEKRIEEDYLIQALEWMESEGVRLVNLSIGYNLGFTDPKENYRPHQMDGKTTQVARAVELAATEKGMLIVVAAGNDAAISSWQIIATPADAEHALTVGASKYEVWDKMNYSSIGADFVPYVNPDISVYSTTGTSFAAPVVTGLAACMWQLDSTLTNLEIMDILKKAGHFYPYPNNYLGYGVPTCPNILRVMEGTAPERPREVRAKKRYRLKRDFEVSYMVAFHKKDGWKVLAREVYRPQKGQIKVKQMEGATQTSVLLGKEVVEIFWK